MGDRAIARWVRDKGVTFDAPLDGLRADPEKLGIFDTLLAACNTVFLGEMNHFIHEKSDYRLLLVRYLQSRGWRYYGEELSWSDGWRVREYLVGGDEARLQRVATFGYKGSRRKDRDDEPTGMFKESFEKYPYALFRAEQERFYRALRVLNTERVTTDRIKLFGFDIDAAPGGAYEDIADMLRPYGNSGAVRQFLGALARVPGETVDEEVQRLEQVGARTPQLRGHVGARVDVEVAAAITTMRESLGYIKITYPAKDLAGVRPGMALREDIMKRNVKRALDYIGPAEGCVFMAHAMHLAKNDELMRERGAVPPGGTLTPSVGHYMTQELGRKVLSVWLLYGGGHDSQPYVGAPQVANYPADTINKILLDYVQSNAPNKVLVIPTGPNGPEIFDKPIGIGHMFNSVFYSPLSRQVDVLCFVPEISPMREL
jgi:erythromycin esterase-like protein